MDWSLRDKVGVEVELAVAQLEAEKGEAEEGVALPDGHEAIAQRRPELHVQLVAVLAMPWRSSNCR